VREAQLRQRAVDQDRPSAWARTSSSWPILRSPEAGDRLRGRRFVATTSSGSWRWFRRPAGGLRPL